MSGDSTGADTETLTDRIAGGGRRVARGVGLAYVAFAMVTFTSRPARAQGASEAADAMCSTGIGSLIGYGLGALVLIFVLLGVVRLMNGVNNRGSAQSQKKQQGKEQITGSVYSFGAATVPALAGAILQASGFPVLPCVDWAAIATLAPAIPV